jgi:hypothetical protein
MAVIYFRNPQYFALIRRVPLLRGIRPFAFKLDLIVNPIDFPAFHRFKYSLLRRVALYTHTPFTPFLLVADFIVSFSSLL